VSGRVDESRLRRASLRSRWWTSLEEGATHIWVPALRVLYCMSETFSSRWHPHATDESQQAPPAFIPSPLDRMVSTAGGPGGEQRNASNGGEAAYKLAAEFFSPHAHRRPYIHVLIKVTTIKRRRIWAFTVAHSGNRISIDAYIRLHRLRRTWSTNSSSSSLLQCL
jgi:hypothetical protein